MYEKFSKVKIIILYFRSYHIDNETISDLICSFKKRHTIFTPLFRHAHAYAHAHAHAHIKSPGFVYPRINHTGSH